MESLANKYRPKVFEDVCEQSVIVDMLKSICERDTLYNRNFLFIGSAGVGKAQPLYSKVLTPDGYVEMRDIQLGDQVVTRNNTYAEVIGVFPQGVRPIYEMTLANGKKWRVADNHINIVYIFLGDERWNTNMYTTDVMRLFQRVDIYVPVPDIPQCSGESTSDADRQIVDIRYIGDEECQCIYVDDKSHSYITDDLIPTHNTTLGRILANTLNHGSGSTIEIDAASNNGVDSMREIVKQASQYPIGSKYKVFILDEVHVLSNTAWQCLLKVLESSPAMSIFILCTTNAEKIPDTIKSRVQTFQLSKISLDGIVRRLKHVLDSEIQEGRSLTYTDEAVSYLGKLAQGGMRDALTLLDTALAYSNDITIENLSKSLNLPEYDDYFDLLSAYSKHDNAKIASIVDKVYNSGTNFMNWFKGFHAFVIQIVKYIYLGDINSTMIPSYYQDKISKYSQVHAAICLKLANKLMKLNDELRGTSYQQEIALSYLCTPTKTK